MRIGIAIIATLSFLALLSSAIASGSIVGFLVKGVEAGRSVAFVDAMSSAVEAGHLPEYETDSDEWKAIQTIAWDTADSSHIGFSFFVAMIVSASYSLVIFVISVVLLVLLRRRSAA